MTYEVTSATYKGQKMYYVVRRFGDTLVFLDGRGEIALLPENRWGCLKRSEAENRVKSYERDEEDFKWCDDD